MDNRLYNRRKELELTLEQIGKACGVGKSTVRKWETGQINNMGRDKILKLAKALKVSPLYILQTTSDEHILSKYEMQLLSLVDKLTNIGKEKVLEYAQDLTSNPVYHNHPSILNAANARTDIEPTVEGQAHDNAIMNDDSEWD